MQTISSTIWHHPRLSRIRIKIISSKSFIIMVHLNNQNNNQIHTKICHTLEISVSLVEMINKSSGRGDNNFNTILQVSNLFTFWNTTIHYRIFDITRLAKLVTLFFNLDSEFTGRCKDQYDRALSRLQIWLSIYVNHGW